MIYVIKKGDTLYSISQRYGIPVDDLASTNQINPDNYLVVGQTLFLPLENTSHTVLKGESLYTISKKYGISLERLKEANPDITPPYTIYPGDEIIIPLTPEKLGEIEVNGFVFPSVRQNVLQKTLPNLTYLSIFSYRVTSSGSLVNIQDSNIIDQAIQAQVAPMMTITNSVEGGGFSGQITNDIFNNEEVEDILIENIIETLNTKNYYGVVVDFEYIMPSDRENYIQFLTKLTNTLHPLGFLVFSALAPKISADQKGTLYEAHDYKAIGQIVDRVIIMTYEWGYLFGPPLAVAPLNKVKEVLDYAVTAIPSDKILMGIPNYGYDWTLPFVQGTSARVVTNVGVVDLAREVGANINFDQPSQSPFFNYYKENKQHVVWFEDARSIDAKLRLVDEYSLAGVSYWELNNYFPQNWLVQDSLYDVVKIIE
jgi:spore germination protein